MTHSASSQSMILLAHQLYRDIGDDREHFVQEFLREYPFEGTGGRSVACLHFASARRAIEGAAFSREPGQLHPEFNMHQWTKVALMKEPKKPFHLAPGWWIVLGASVGAMIVALLK